MKSVAAALGLLLVTVLGAQSATAAPAATASAVHVTTAGDFAQTSDTGAVLDAVKATGSQATFALGDLSYGVPGQEKAWCDFVTAHVGATHPFELLSGNHESNGLNGDINAFVSCLPNRLSGLVGSYGKQYYVDLPAQNPVVRFVMISPGLTYSDGPWDYSAGSPRYVWTGQAIDGARSAGIPWVVVGMHKPCLTVGKYGCDPGADILNLLVSKKVDLVLSGHEHTYQRSKQLRLGAGCPAIVPGSYTPACVADSDTSLAQGGTVAMVVGTGGKSLYNVNTADPEAGYFAALSGANANPTWGALDLRADASALRASFVRGSGGTFSDGFTITRPVSYASDQFGRTVSGGLGTAPVGGPWSVSGPTATVGVNGTGNVALGAGVKQVATLPSVSAPATDLRVTVGSDKNPAGGGLQLTAYGRRVSGSGAYGARLRVSSSGSLGMEVVRESGTGADSTILAPVAAGLTVAPGDRFHLRMQTTGTSPTTVRAKVWRVGAAEPAAWLQSVTDSAAGLQTSGSVGFGGYLFPGVTNSPVTVKVDDLTVSSP